MKREDLEIPQVKMRDAAPKGGQYKGQRVVQVKVNGQRLHIVGAYHETYLR